MADMADFVTSEGMSECWNLDWNNTEESALAFNATGHDAAMSLPYLTPIEDISNIDPELTSIHLESSTADSSTIHVSQTLPSPTPDQIAPNASYRQQTRRKHRKIAPAPYPSGTNRITKSKLAYTESRRHSSTRNAGDATIVLEKLVADRHRSSQPPRREHSQFPAGITGIAGNNTTSLQSPSTIIAMDTSSSTEDTGGLEWRNECRLDLEEIDFQCLAPGSLLTDNLINAVLSLLSTLAPCSLIIVDSRIDSLEPNMARAVDQALLTGGTILVPIHVPPLDPSLSHWLLAVLDPNGAHINLAGHDNHVDFAKTKIMTLFPSTTREHINITEHAYQETDDTDTGMAVLIKAMYTALGFTLPKTLDAKPWRDVLTLLLRVALSQSHHLDWADGPAEDAVPFEVEYTPEKDESMLPCLAPGPISYAAVRDAIASLEEFYSNRKKVYHSQLACLEKVMEERRATMIRQGRSIHKVLEGLSRLAFSGEEEAKRLNLERSYLNKCLNALDEWQESFDVVLFANPEALDSMRCHLKEGLQHLNTCLARRNRMVTAVSESAIVVDEAIKALEESHKQHTDSEGSLARTSP